MKRLFIIIFAVSSLIRPSLVLCMEATGDIRVEYQQTSCCAAYETTSDIALGGTSADDCEGCLDFSITTQSRLKRVSNVPTPAPIAIVLPVVSVACISMLVVDRTANDSQAMLHSRILSTTVIRR